jgi:hypothetical protein
MARRSSDAGKRPRGWLGPGLTETWETPDILVEEGYEYVADWVLDDQPVWLKTRGKPIESVPYTQECNDVAMMLIQHHKASEFLERAIDQFEQIYADAEGSARVMAISMHPYIMGAPHRTKYFRRIFETIRLPFWGNQVTFPALARMITWRKHMSRQLLTSALTAVFLSAAAANTLAAGGAGGAGSAAAGGAGGAATGGAATGGAAPGGAAGSVIFREPPVRLQLQLLQELPEAPPAHLLGSTPGTPGIANRPNCAGAGGIAGTSPSTPGSAAVGQNPSSTPNSLTQ